MSNDKKLPLYLEEEGEKRQVGTAVPVFDGNGDLTGFNADITDEKIIGSMFPRQNPLCRIRPFSIGNHGFETS